jgi:hypothetical protein
MFTCFLFSFTLSIGFCIVDNSAAFSSLVILALCKKRTLPTQSDFLGVSQTFGFMQTANLPHDAAGKVGVLSVFCFSF